MSYAAALRDVREIIAPEIPNLTKDLPEHEFAIVDSIYAALCNNGTDVRTIPEIDWIKTEQQSIVTWGGGLVRRALVNGDGRSAVFKPGVLRLQDAKSIYPYAEYGTQFEAAIDITLINCAKSLLGYLPDGSVTKDAIIPEVLSIRYMDLGYRRQDLVKVKVGAISLAAEIKSLKTALSSLSLSQESVEHVKFVAGHFDGDDSDILKAAHDTSYVPYALSAHHVHELDRSRLAVHRSMGNALIVKHEKTGRYIVSAPDGMPIQFPRDPDETYDTTLKCPLRADGNLQSLIGACINAAADLGFFDRNLLVAR